MTDEYPSQTPPPTPSLEVVTGEKAPAWPPVRHPFQVSTMVAFVALGLAYYTRPTRTLEEVADLVIAVWVIILAISGVIGLISAAIAYRAENTSLLLERIALVGAGSFCFLYSILNAVNAASGEIGWSGFLIYAVLGVACGWRLIQVQRVVAWRTRRGKALQR